MTTSALVRVNLGCWRFRLPGWINVDLDPLYGDVVADARALPFATESVDEVYAGHLLEHFAPQDNPLPEWARILKPGGRITITVPDVEKGLAGFRAGTVDFTLLHRIVYGSFERDLQRHDQIFTEPLLVDRMRPLFPDARIIPTCPMVVEDVPWQTVARGHKPLSPWPMDRDW